MNGEIKFVGEMSSVSLGKNDVVVVHCDHRMSGVQREWLLDYLKFHFPDNKAIVIDGGAKLGVVEKSA